MKGEPFRENDEALRVNGQPLAENDQTLRVNGQPFGENDEPLRVNGACSLGTGEPSCEHPEPLGDSSDHR